MRGKVQPRRLRVSLVAKPCLSVRSSRQSVVCVVAKRWLVLYDRLNDCCCICLLPYVAGRGRSRVHRAGFCAGATSIRALTCPSHAVSFRTRCSHVLCLHLRVDTGLWAFFFCVCAYIYMYIHTHMHPYVKTHTHTHTHTQVTHAGRFYRHSSAEVSRCSLKNCGRGLARHPEVELKVE